MTLLQVAQDCLHESRASAVLYGGLERTLEVGTVEDIYFYAGSVYQTPDSGIGDLMIQEQVLCESTLCVL